MAMIRPLPEVAAAQVKASVLITSLQDVVLGLVENSLDSAATRVDIEVDFEKGFCLVEDDGAGIAPLDFSEQGGLAKIHHTSKPEENLNQHGRKGVFLWAVSTLATVTIISQREPGSTPSSMMIHHGRRIHRESLSDTQPLRSLKHGTRVEIRNLFGNMPVRAMQRPKRSDGSTQRAWKRTLKYLTGTLLAWGESVEISFRSLNGLQKARVPKNDRLGISTTNELVSSPPKSLFHIPVLKNILLNGASVDPQDWPQWTSTSAQTKQWTIRAILSRQPSSSRDVQFISIGIYHVKEEDSLYRLYEEVNRVFELSSFGTLEESPQVGSSTEDNNKSRRNGQTRKEPRIRGKGVEKWPMFFIRIDNNAGSSHHSYNSNHASENEESIVPILKVLIESFLIQHNIRVWDTKTSRQSASPALISADKNVQVVYQPIPKQDAPRTSVLSGSTASIAYEGVRNSIRQGRRALSSLQITGPEIGHSDPLQDQSKAPIGTAASSTSDTTIIPITIVDATIQGTPTTEQSSHHHPKPSEPLNTERVDLSAQSKFFRPPTTDFRSNKLSRSIDEMSKAATRTPWASNLLARWENPVFNATEPSIPQLSHQCHIIADGVLPNQFLEHGSPTDLLHESIQGELKISRGELLNAEVISQVDRKFILIKIRPMETLRLLSTEFNSMDGNTTPKNLILVDQHAADERIRVEELLTALCQPAPTRLQGFRSPLGCVSAIDTEILSAVIGFNLKEEECALFRSHAKHFARWGILYALRHDRDGACVSDEHNLFVLSLPPLISERCRAEPKLLSELLRRDVWARRDRSTAFDALSPPRPDSNSFWSQIHSCPEGILDIVNSRACRSAIMFNDELTLLTCETLVQRLGRCRLPFQCAHGRPSMVPVADLETIALDWKTTAHGDHVNPENINPRNFLSAWDDMNIAQQL